MSRIWPDTLPLAQLPGYELEPVDQAVRTDMEVGTKRNRRISFARIDAVSVSWRLNDVQKAAFYAWYGDEAWSLSGDSEDLSGWSRLNATLVPDAVNGPSLQGAGKLVEDVFDGIHRTQLALPAVLDGETVILTVSLKAEGRTKARVGIVDRNGVLRSADADLSAGTLGNLSGLDASAIESRGGGWWRVKVVAPADTGLAEPLARITLMNGGAVSYLGDGSSGIAICEQNVRKLSGFDLFLPCSADGKALGAAGGTAWFEVPLAFGGGYRTVEARFEAPFNATPLSGLNWQVSTRLEVRDA